MTFVGVQCAVGRGRGSREPSVPTLLSGPRSQLCSATLCTADLGSPLPTLLTGPSSRLCAATLCTASRLQSSPAPSRPTLLLLCRAKCASAEQQEPPSPRRLTPLLRLCCCSSTLTTVQSRAEQSRVSSAALNQAPKGSKVPVQILLEGNAKYVMQAGFSVS